MHITRASVAAQYEVASQRTMLQALPLELLLLVMQKFVPVHHQKQTGKRSKANSTQSQLPDNKDLRSLYRLCRSLQAVVEPALYRDLVVAVHEGLSPHQDPVRGMIEKHRKRRVLDHTQKITFRPPLRAGTTWQCAHKSSRTS
ncbi:hypothetical protein BDW66DRAFT_135970 [Aspergillus desertorum]